MGHAQCITLTDDARLAGSYLRAAPAALGS